MNPVSGQALLELVILALPVAAIAWSVTHEELFRELHDYCVERSRRADGLLARKFFYSSPASIASATTWRPAGCCSRASRCCTATGADTSSRGLRLSGSSNHHIARVRTAEAGHPQRTAGHQPERSRQQKGRRPQGQLRPRLHYDTRRGVVKFRPISTFNLTAPLFTLI